MTVNSMSQGPYVSKWHTFAASAVLQSCAGLAYSYALYAPAIKDSLRLSQTQVATVGSAVNLGGYFAVGAGFIYDQLKDHHKLGPRLVVYLGCLCCTCGYLGMYLMVSGHAARSFPQLLLFAAAAGNMGVWFDTSALVTSVRNFPNDRGFVVGVLKSFLGLSSSIFTSIYASTFEPDATRYLLMLALAPSALALAVSFGLNYVPFVEASEGCHAATQRRFLTSFLMVGALALWQMGSAIVQAAYPLGSAGRTAIVLLMGALLGAAVLLPLPSVCGPWRAVYAHPYIHTRESLADDEDGGGGGSSEDGWQLQAQQHSAQERLGSPGGRVSQGSPPPGFTSVPHQRVAVGQLRTLKQGAPAARAGSSGSSSRRQGTAGSPLPVLHGVGSGGGRDTRPSSNSSSSSSAAGGGGLHRHHVGVHVHGAGGADDAQLQEAAPLLSALGGPHHDSAKGVLLAGGSAGGGVTAAALGPRPLPLAADGPPHDGPPLQLGSLTTRQMLGTATFWLLFLQFTVASGMSLAYLNNLGQLVVALGGEHDGQVVFVSLFSVANAAGRLVAGYVPERALHARGTPRTLFLALTAALLAASALAAAYSPLGGLYVISLLLGLAFGAHWSLLPAITSDLFGLRHFAANYTTLQFAPAAGSYLLATRLTGWLYDRAAAAHGDPKSCVGSDCFREAFLLMAALGGVSSVACSVATARSRRAYAALAQHLHSVDVAEAHTPPAPLGGGSGGGGSSSIADGGDGIVRH